MSDKRSKRNRTHVEYRLQPCDPGLVAMLEERRKQDGTAQGIGNIEEMFRGGFIFKDGGNGR